MATKKPTQATPKPCLDALENLLSEVGQEQAIEFYERLPGVILTHIERIATAPTPDEVRRINAAFTKWYPSIRPRLVQAINRVNEAQLALQGGGDEAA